MYRQIAGTSPIAVSSSSTSVGTTRAWVDRAVSVGTLLAFAKINCDERDREPLFGDKYAYTS